MSDPLSLPVAELTERYRKKDLSPLEVTRAALDRIGKLNPLYNAFCVVGEESALRAARESEARWQRGTPLGLVDGVPTTVKDLLWVKGWPTLRGSRSIARNQPWDEDSASVSRLREQGAVFLGKTTTSEFGWKGVTDSPLTGLTINPWNKFSTPGGSSGGAAVAAALAMGNLHVGTDGGGSIRIPAGFCGVFGFKPTWGLVPVYPHSPAFTLWHQGPLSRNVADAAWMLSVISHPDERDWAAAPPLDIDYRVGLEAGVRGLRMAYSPTLGFARVEPEIAARVERGVNEYAQLGAIVEQIDLGLDDPIAIMKPLWAVALALAVAPMTPAERALCDPPMLELAEQGFHLSALEYRQLEREREALGRRMNLLYQDYDLLITPQMPITAFAAGHNVPPGSGMHAWWQWSPFTYLFNLTQQPAATVPCGFAKDGLPVAMQLVGAKFSDRQVLRAARAYEKMHPFVMPQP